MNILIIEDEAKTARELKTTVERIDADLHVVAIVPSVKRGIDWLRTQPAPQLILSDIHLSDGLSFEIFHNVQTPCPVIFCTAFDHYAIRAFNANGIDYLLKPIDEDKLAKSLQKYSQLQQLFKGSDTPSIAQRIETLLGQFLPTVYKSALLVFSNEKIIPVQTDDIAFIHSVKGIVQLYTKTNQVYLIHEVLDELGPQLDPRLFFRANRQFIINRSIIVMAEHYFNRRLILKLIVETPERVIVSKIKVPELLAWMSE
jgi:two-component system response regulator LytT